MKINSTIFFTIISLFYSSLLIVVYFLRRRINTPENKMYSKLIIVNFVGIILELLCCIFAGYAMDYLCFYTVLNKMYLIYLIVWCSLFGLYVFLISFNTSRKEKLRSYMNKMYVMYLLLGLIIVFLIILLPVNFNFNSDGYVMYSYGYATSVVYIGSFISILLMIVCLVKNYKNIKNKKYLPIYVYLSVGTLTTIIQNIFPELLLATTMETFITVIMYFTIENPDMKLLEEVHRAKEISDNANEEKTLFLYNMTQEIRNTTSEINNDASLILDSNSIDEDKDLARDIIATTSKFTTMTNEILDISRMDLSNVKVYNTKYNVKTLIKQLVSVYTDMCKNKYLKFRTNIDHDIPEILYGDSIELKEVLTIILNNSVKYTNNGYIEFDVNTIIKNDICRLIITIEDSGVGIKSEDINRIKINNKSLAKANKLITLMNGTMLISSNYGIGTKVKVIIDQKIGEVVDSEISKYEETFNNVNILMVDDSEAGIKIVEKVLKGTNIKIDYANNGRECLNKIKINKYDLILLDEELSQISGIELMKKIKEIRNFDVPVILLTKDNNYEYNEKYLSVGFSDYILKPVKSDILLEKINKYTGKNNSLSNSEYNPK